MILPESALNLLEKQGFEKAGTGLFTRINLQTLPQEF